MLDNDIKLAINTITGWMNDVEFSKIYPFTNENIKACFNHFDFKNKDVLSVLASSDQVFDMFLKGAKKIETFDINPLTKYYFHLKKAAILALSQYDFINFFNGSIDSKFNKNVFKKIAKHLTGDNYEFWNTLFDIFTSLELDNLFYHTFNIPYLFNKDKYKLLQNKIDSLDVEFINCHIFELVNILNTKYDVIYLSNILGRLGFIPPFCHIDDDFEIIATFLKNLSTHLKDEGKIIVNYYFLYSQITEMFKILKEIDIDTSHLEKIKFKHDEYSYGGSLIYRK